MQCLWLPFIRMGHRLAQTTSADDHPDRIADAHRYARADLDQPSELNPHTNPNRHQHREANTNPHHDAHTNTHSDRHTNEHGNTHANSHSDTVHLGPNRRV